MNQENMTMLLAYVDKLGAKLGVASGEVFSWYVKQVYIEAFMWYVGAVVCFIGTVVFLYYNKMYDRRQDRMKSLDKYDPDEDMSGFYAFGGLASGVVAIIILFVAVIHTFFIFNAKLHAFKALVTQLSGVM